MSIKQKLSLGAFLTMNVWLIVIALVRILWLKQNNVYDGIWATFCELLEAHVAILASCITAFRSAFVKNRSRAPEKESPPAAYRSRRGLLWSHSRERRPLDHLPSIPRAVLTGMHTEIWNNDRIGTTSRDSVFSEQRNDSVHVGIHAKHDWPLSSTQT